MRKLMWLSIGFLAAGVLCAYCGGSWYIAGACIFVTAGVVLAVLTRWIRPLRVAATVFVGLSLGCVWFSLFDAVYLSDARKLNGETDRVTVIVRDYSYETDYGCAVDGTLAVEGKTYKIRVYLDEYEDLRPGNRIIGSFKFKMTTGDGIDDILYHSGKGIYLLAYQQDRCVIERFWSVPLRDYPALWRQWLKNTIDEVFAEDVSGFAKALLLGDRTDIGYEISTAFKVSGISHIIAVSGLHVSILFGVIHFLSGKRRFWTAIFGIPSVLVFAAIAGFTPSVTRAAVMQILVMAAMVFDKEYDPPTALSFAALVLVLTNPMVVTSVSFQLSFACMAGIFLLSEPIRGWLMDRKRLGRFSGRFIRWIGSSVSVSVSATVFTTPLTAVYFGTVSLISVLTNLLTLWIITFIFCGIILTCGTALFSAGLSSGIAWVIAWPVRYVLLAARVLGELPLAAVYTKSGYIVAWLVFVYVLLAVCLLFKERPTTVFAAVAAVSLCLCVLLSWLEPLTDEYRMTVLDVGQGQAILLQSEGKTYIVDCGGDYDEDAADITAETLLSQGIRCVDGIILTHFDRDHSGGIAHLLTRIDTELILVPYAMDENGVADTLRDISEVAVVSVAEDLNIAYGDTELTIFAPESYNSGNESGLCVLFRKGNCDILITGDRGEAGENLLLKYHDLPQVDVLVVGHHGSKYSTSEALLEAVQPSCALISVGEDNSYGHPAQLILDRLEEYGCTVYRTDENGTIIYRG